MAETTDESEAFVKALFGGQDEQKFIREMAGVFALAVVSETLRERYPDLVARKQYVDNFILAIQERVDEGLAEHRQMMDSTIGKLFGSMLGTAEGTAAQYKEKVDSLRTYLYHLAGVEA